VTTVATYYTLLDTEIELRIGGDIDRTFTQSVGVAPVSGEGAVVTWMARRKGTGSVTYTVTLNGSPTPLNTYTLTSADRFVVQETIDTNEINQGDNDLVFAVTGGTGTLGLGDVMLWHRVNV
jgi:hypothetical protein